MRQGILKMVESWSKGLGEVVILPIAVQDLARVSEDQGAFSVLFAVAQVAVIEISVWHVDFAEAFRFLIYKLTFIFEAIRCLERSFSVPQSSNELSFVLSPIIPNIFPLSIWISFTKATVIQISIDKFFLSPPIFLKSNKSSFVFLPINYVNSVSLSFAFHPLSIVAISMSIRPNSASMPVSIFPFSDVVFSIEPLELTVPVSFLVHKLTFVDSRSIDLQTFCLDIVMKDSLENFLILDENAQSFFSVIDYLAKKQFVGRVFDNEVRAFQEFTHDDFTVKRIVIFYERGYFFSCWYYWYFYPQFLQASKWQIISIISHLFGILSLKLIKLWLDTKVSGVDVFIAIVDIIFQASHF